MHRPALITDRPPFVEVMRKLGLEPDPWQVEVFQSEHPQMLLNCCRQAGKSTVVAILGLLEAMFKPMTRVVQSSAIARNVEADELLLRPSAQAGGEAGQRARNRDGQFQPDRQRAVPGGYDSRVCPCRSAHHRRGRAGAGRSLPGGKADAGGVVCSVSLHGVDHSLAEFGDVAVAQNRRAC